MATFHGPDPHLASQIAALQHRFGRVDVIENQTFTVPGSIGTYDLRAQDPHGPYGAADALPALRALPGRADQVAVTAGVASELRPAGRRHLAPGRHDPDRGRHRPEPPEPAGRVRARRAGPGAHPTQVTVLFDAAGVPPAHRPERRDTARRGTPATRSTPRPSCSRWPPSACCSSPWWRSAASPCWPSAGCAPSACSSRMGATDRNVRLVVRANGVVVGVVGALLGARARPGAWLAYRPHVEQSSHHLIGVFAAALGGDRPGHGRWPWSPPTSPPRGPPGPITRVPDRHRAVRAARPAQQIHRSAVPGVVLAVSPSSCSATRRSSGNGGGGLPELVSASSR